MNTKKFDIVTGKSGVKFLRICGDAVVLPVWNTRTGEVMDSNELVERIGLCLDFCDEYSNDELKSMGKLDSVLNRG